MSKFVNFILVIFICTINFTKVPIYSTFPLFLIEDFVVSVHSTDFILKANFVKMKFDIVC